jgi:16S rRNA (cytidine1402-2'-O)-methyltransferase
MSLYLVGTPIGNLEDITLRAVRVLQEVDWIAAEDTRHTGRLLHHLGVTTPQISYHQHNEQQQIPHLLAKLQGGQSIALVTDAGMPGISDPGYHLVAACVAQGVTVTPIPGPTALVTALSASGISSDRFVFEGFLPAKGGDRHQRIQAIAQETRTIICYESPHRLLRTLEELGASLGAERPVVLARELTKRHEEFWRGTLGAAIDHARDRSPQGEYTIILGGAAPLEVHHSDAALKAELRQLLAQGLSRSAASKQLADLSPRGKRHIYQLALTLED